MVHSNDDSWSQQKVTLYYIKWLLVAKQENMTFDVLEDFCEKYEIEYLMFWTETQNKMKMSKLFCHTF